MSHYCDEHYDEYTEERLTDGIDHACCACKEAIPAGTSYWDVFWSFDGDDHNVKRCERCQALHLHLRKKGDPHGMWPDERLACGKKYEAEWGDMPDDVAALAFALPTDPISTIHKDLT